MDCNTALGYIEPFLHDELTDEEKEGFIYHVKQCKDCRNELEFYFITHAVFDELNKDEDSEDLDYIAALDKKLEISQKGLNRRRRLRQIAAAIIVLILLGVAAFLFFWRM
ncbi:MAG: zf-HC2 domain-containing protein [Lachnospiraceae bacterium]|nr:zf-HC2 domain-containing protein [Lachnospiraceae bacterium]